MKPIAAIGLALVLGCSHGRPINFDDTSKLTPGLSTRADAERIFGPPGAVATDRDGTVLVTWAYAHSGYAGYNTGSKYLTLSFRPEGTYIGAVKSATGSDIR